MSGQTLFDIAEPINSPQFAIGDNIYHVVLDVIEHYKVSGIFNIGVDIYGEKTTSGHTLWRYHLEGMNKAGHSVFGEYEMGDRWFSSLYYAHAKAETNLFLIEAEGNVISFERLVPTEYVAYTHCTLEGLELYTTAARLGTRGVYEKDLYCYPFIKVFDSEKEAGLHYKKLEDKFQGRGGFSAEFIAMDMYWVKENLWSSYEYAERHGDWDHILNPQNHDIKYKPNKGRDLTR